MKSVFVTKGSPGICQTSRGTFRDQTEIVQSLPSAFPPPPLSWQAQLLSCRTCPEMESWDLKIIITPSNLKPVEVVCELVVFFFLTSIQGIVLLKVHCKPSSNIRMFKYSRTIVPNVRELITCHGQVEPGPVSPVFCRGRPGTWEEKRIRSEKQ